MEGATGVLIARDVNGALHVRHISRPLNIDPHKCFNVLEKLVDAGAARTRRRAKARKWSARRTVQGDESEQALNSAKAGAA